MKRSKLLVLVTALLFVVSLTGWAKTKNEAAVTLSEAVKVAGTQLAPGDYRLRWEGNGTDVNVTFLKDNKALVTAPAKLEVKNDPYDGTALITKPEAGGVHLLTAIQLKKVALEFGTPPDMSK